MPILKIESFFFSCKKKNMYAEPITTGLKLGTLLISIAFFLDFFISYTEVSVTQKDLYRIGFFYNIFNLLFITPLVYIIVYEYFLNIKENHFEFWKCLAIIVIQNIGYYFSHRCMHSKYLYHIHKFHHQYNQIVIPSSAFAVTASEFVLAYLSPLFVASYVLYPTMNTMSTTTFFIGVCNLLIHTPQLAKVQWISYIVSPSSHMKHHIVQKSHFAAPILDIDKIISDCQ